MKLEKMGIIKKGLVIETTKADKAITFWKNVLYSSGIGGSLLPDNKEDFFFKFTGYSFGKSALYYYQTSAVTHRRTQTDCSQNPSNVYMLARVKKGSVFVEQRNREVLIKAGDCFLAHSAKPLSRRFQMGCEMTSFVLPQNILQRWVLSPQDITGNSLLKASPFGKALAASLEALSMSSLDQLAVAPDAFIEQTCCLLALISGPAKHELGSYKQALFQRFSRALRVLCCEPGFDEGAFAHEQCISTRTIQNVFASVGTSFRREVMALRMERAKGFLDDPRYNKKSISEIADLLGYRHASHFITHFHRAFGVSPAVYRKIRRG